MSAHEENIDRRSGRLGTAILVLLCSIPTIGTILYGAVDSITWSLIVALIGFVVVLWTIDAWRRKALVVHTSSLQLPLLAIILLGLIQLLPFGTDTAAGMLAVPAKHALSLDPYSTRFFIRNLVVFVIFLAGCQTFLTTEKQLKRTVLFIVIFSSLMAFVGILQKIANADAIYGLRVPFQANPFSSFVNQHHFAAFMEMTGGLTMGLLFGSLPKERKFLLGMAFVVMVAALIMTGSRGGMISFAAVTLIAGSLSFIYRERYDKRSDVERARGRLLPMLIGIPAVTLVVVLLVIWLGGDQALTRGIGLSAAVGEGGDVSNGRLHFWAVALQIFAANPIVGVGFNAFGVAFTRYDTWNGLFRVEQAHNDYLQMLAEGGLIALSAVLAFIVIVFRKALKRIATTKSGFRREAAIGALAGCVGIMVHSFFDFPLRTWSNTFFLLLLISIATVYVAHDEPESPKRRRRRTT